MTPQTVVVAAGLVVDGDRVLLARRRQGDHLAGRWEFPGGKVRTGESVPAALVRELHEELGVRAEPGALWGVLHHRYPEREVRIHFHFAEIVDGTPRPHAAEELCWATPAEMHGMPFPEADRVLVDELIRCERVGIPLRSSRHPCSAASNRPGTETKQPDPESNPNQPGSLPSHPGNGEDIA